MKERGMMARRPRFISMPLVGTILLCLLIGLYLVAIRHFSKPDRSVPVVKHSVDAHPDDVLKYWTADKMRNTKANNMPHIDAPNQEKQHPRRPPHV